MTGRMRMYCALLNFSLLSLVGNKGNLLGVAEEKG